ncbi:hypothetical protein DCAR_0205750 [Daucus carota subsp. sativus]|uniref:Uncharacterized protein n=2 Tax=Daucus carota subsp. sativus TaxID=79200 RepID=A0AAF0WBI2_DAUCS|nr:PREDICTED: GDSL esterase/lipase At1g29670-like [Daucus carota subsp. sativus]WOG86539.1 hypothetical protein DCAR_0205750 [Daucus carota subsp. sativus]
MASASIIWFLGCILILSLNLTPFVAAVPIVPGYYIFGDSLADSGNNNNLMTLAKANFHPYGIDYPGGPTGRFTNGRTYVDFIAEFLGFDHHMPPFSTANGDQILQGVNYASAGAGIRPETGKICGERFHIMAQLDHHRTTVSRIKQLKGNNDQATQEHLSKCIYTVGIGSNDYMNNYLVVPANPKDVVFTPDKWAEDLIGRYNTFLRGLYDLGARKIVLWGLGPIGCEPSQVKALRMAGKPGCVDMVNHIVSLYNNRFAPLVDELNKLPDAKFIFVNNTHISPGNNPASIGVKVGDRPCCTTVAVPGTCIRGMPPCPNRDEYSFFDSYHPTEKAVLPGAKRAFQAQEPQDVYPMDISRLAQL